MVKKGERNNQERQDNGYRSISPEGCQTHIHPCTNHSNFNGSDNRLPTEWQTDSMTWFTGFNTEYETEQGKWESECWLLSSALVIYPGLTTKKRTSWFGRSPASRSYAFNANHYGLSWSEIITARNLEYAVCRAWTISPCVSLSSMVSREICLGICWNSCFTFILRLIAHGIAIACPGLFISWPCLSGSSLFSGQPLTQSTLVDMDFKPYLQSSLVEQLGQLKTSKVIFHCYGVQTNCPLLWSSIEIIVSGCFY